MKTLLISLSLISSIITSHAQTIMYGVEWDNTSSVYNFVSVNPPTGVKTIINTLPDVNSFITNDVTSFNESSEYYFIKDNNDVIYTIDINTGDVISKPIETETIITDMHYDKNTDLYYAIELEDTTTPGPIVISTPTSGGVSYFVTINPSNGAITRINTLSALDLVRENCSAYNAANQEFTIVDNLDIIYTINAVTGSIITSQSLSTKISELRFDVVTNNYYAIEYDEVGDINYLTTVNPTTGVVTQVASVSYLLGEVQAGTSTIDTVNNLYAVIDQNNVLYSIDLATANVTDTSQINSELTNLIISASVIGGKTPLAGEYPVKKSKIIESNLRIGSQNVENLFETSINNVKTYPNPTTNNLTIELNTVPSTLTVYDFNGRLIKTEVLENKFTIIDVSYFEKNLYYFKIKNSRTTETKKIIVQ